MPAKTVIQNRRGTASEWTSANPTLAAGEIGFETDTNKVKIGNGSTAWSSLSYFGGGTGANITSSDTPPSSPSNNDLWFKSTSGRTYIYYDSYWIEIDSNTPGPTGLTGPAGANGTNGTNGIGASLGMVSGNYYTANSSNSSANAIANRSHYIPIFVINTTTFDRIAIRTGSTFSGTAVVRLGIYNDNIGVPSTVVLDAGTVSATAANTVYEITISQSLSPGTYWLAFNSQTAATTNNYRTSTTPYFQSTMGTTATGGAQVVGWYQDSVTGAFGTATSLIGLGNIPTTYLRAA